MLLSEEVLQAMQSCNHVGSESFSLIRISTICLRRSTANDDNVLKDMTDANWRLSIQDIARSVNIHHSAVLRHLKAMRKLDKWLPLVGESRETCLAAG